MTVRLRKEVRELFPAFAVTVLLVVLPFALWGRRAEGFPLVALALGSAAMGAISFGTEFQRRTFGQLLSQPVARSVVWNEKMLVLGAGLAVVTACGLVLGVWLFRSDDAEPGAVILIPLCAFAGAPLMTLYFRNTIAGGVLGIALPGLLLAGVVAVIPERLLDAIAGPALLVVLPLYCCLVYVTGYKFFKNFQLVEGQERELRVPLLERLLAVVLQESPRRRSGAMLALLRKECRLQQVTLLVTGFFVLFALIGAALRWLQPERPEWAEGIIAADFMVYVFLLPLLMGAVGFAEERSWGVREWHLTLPPSAFRQWAAKLGMVVPLSLVLGVMLPGGLFLAGYKLFAHGSQAAPVVGISQIGMLCLGALLLLSLACFTGSLSSGTLKAIVGAMAVCVLCGLAGRLVLLAAGVFTELDLRLVENPGLPFWWFAAWWMAAFICLLQIFAYFNFRRSGAGRGGAAAQVCLVVGMVVLMMIAFSAEYLQ